MSSNRVTIKGTSDGLVITMGAGTWSGLMAELEKHLGKKASFFKGGRVALRVGPRQLSLPELAAVGQILDRHQVSLWAVESNSAATRAVAREFGLEIELFPPQITTSVTDKASLEGESLVIQRTLRSGQIVHHSGHVLVIGDVNPGAEVRAGGHVVVWGRLRGTVHAGVGEQGLGEKAIVCALQLSPTQLRIGEHLTRSPADETHRAIAPEMASVQNNQIVAELWK